MSNIPLRWSENAFIFPYKSRVAGTKIDKSVIKTAKEINLINARIQQIIHLSYRKEFITK
tara:strand:+ start:307 stop:486 length:180 start_codon:yes stop_codon:yes gene_type:complete